MPPFQRGLSQLLKRENRRGLFSDIMVTFPLTMQQHNHDSEIRYLSMLWPSSLIVGPFEADRDTATIRDK